MSEVAWFAVVLGLILLILGLQAASVYLWWRGVRGDNRAERREREADMRRHPSARARPKAA
jgi:membrane protein implicated in regulation of membrane protease activity